MNLNIEAEEKNTFDAIVVGTGISGGWAAKELTEKGLKTLVLGILEVETTNLLF